MPTYEYRCPKCHNEFEEFQKITSKPVAKCPKCGARAERLLSGGAGLVFKGSGFYLTDYGRAGQSRAEKPEGSEKAEKAAPPAPPGKSDALAAKPRKKKDR